MDHNGFVDKALVDGDETYVFDGEHTDTTFILKPTDGADHIFQVMVERALSRSGMVPEV